MKHVLLACLLVATFEQPIGHSMDGFVIRHTINYCHGFSSPIQVVEEVVNGRTGERVGSEHRTWYEIPAKPDAPPEIPPAQVAP